MAIKPIIWYVVQEKKLLKVPIHHKFQIPWHYITLFHCLPFQMLKYCLQSQHTIDCCFFHVMKTLSKGVQSGDIFEDCVYFGIKAHNDIRWLHY